MMGVRMHLLTLTPNSCLLRMGMVAWHPTPGSHVAHWNGLGAPPQQAPLTSCRSGSRPEPRCRRRAQGW